MLGESLHIISQIIQVLLIIYLGSTSLYIFIFSLAGIFPSKTKRPVDFIKRRFAILIPCYKEDEVIFDVAREALNQIYPKTHFDVIVIADKFEAETLERLKEIPIRLFRANFRISTKTRALNYALSYLNESQYDIAIVLDADNIMEPYFVAKVNEAFSHGYIAVQGHRTAKNVNTHFAVLDAVSEEINNNIFRKGHRAMGFSSALIGSAMAFDFTYFKKMMSEVEVVGGFDKEIELRLLSEKHIIEYLPNAVVFDEKVQNVKVFSQQRRRWLSAQFHYFGKHFIPALKELLKNNNIDYFNKAYHYLQLPRILLLGLLVFITSISWIFNPLWFSIAWSSALFLTTLAILLAIPIKYYNFNTFKALIALPSGFLFMLFSLLRIRGANKKFIHTKHTYNAFQIKKK
jgi:cellulose synthase/poly-beta-1,6-N-acetylglucosamine synthase-like glycosyltransferase